MAGSSSKRSGSGRSAGGGVEAGKSASAAPRYLTDRLGSLSPYGTVNRRGRRRDAPSEPFVLQVGKRRAAFTDSNRALAAYQHHIKTMSGTPKKSPNAVLWNRGGIMAQSRGVETRVARKMQAAYQKQRATMASKEPQLASSPGRTALQMGDKKVSLVGKPRRRRAS